MNYLDPTSPTLRRPEPDIAINLTKPKPRAAQREIVVVGAGGHGRELCDIVRDVAAEDDTIRLLGVVDDGTPDRLALAKANIGFLGTSSSIAHREVDVMLGMGDPTVRAKLDATLNAASRALVHPTAVIGPSSTLAEGAVLAQAVVVTTNVTIGRHSHINIGATVSHDCTIGAFVTVCPGVTVTGDVTVDNGVFIGAGATILPRVHIGANAVIGAGAVVVEDVAPDTTVAGVPARQISGSVRSRAT